MTPKQFVDRLRRGDWAPVYFFCGEEAFLHQKCRQELLKALPEEAHAWGVHSLEWRAGELAGVLDQASQMPMVGPRNLFLIRDAEDFAHAKEADYEALQGYLRQPPLFSTVVFMAEEPDRRRRFVTLLFKQAEVVEMRRPEAAEVVRWISRLLQRQGVEIDREAAEELAEEFGRNLLWIHTELEKLRLSRPEQKRITVRDLESLVSLAEDHEVTRLLRCIAERKGREALLQLAHLIRSHEPELRLLWHIGHLFRRSLSLSNYPDRYPARPGRGADLLPRIAARSYSHQERLQALRSVHEADLEIKSSWKDTHLHLEFLIWKIIERSASKVMGVSGGTQDREKLRLGKSV